MILTTKKGIEMQQLIEKALKSNKNRQAMENAKNHQRLSKDYEDIKIMLKSVLDDDAQEIIANGEPYYTNRDKAPDWNTKCYLKCGDWLFDEAGTYGGTPRCRLISLENYSSESWSSNWVEFSDLATFGEAITDQVNKTARRIELEKRQQERAEQLAQKSPYASSVSVFKQLIFDIESNRELSPAQRLVIALTDYFRRDDEIESYDPDEDDDNDDESL